MSPLSLFSTPRPNASSGGRPPVASGLRPAVAAGRGSGEHLGPIGHLPSPGRGARVRPPWVRAVLSALRAVPSVGLPLRMSLPGPGPAGSVSDSQLVAAAKYGDPGAFEALVARHAAGLHAVARRLVGDDLARDVVQDSLFAAYRSLRRFRGDASFGTYLHGIVVNRCRRVGPRWKGSTVAPDALDAAPSSSPGPEDVAVGNDLRGRVEAALRGLPADFREALALREFAGLSYNEIARVLDVPIGTVRSRIARGRALLRDELERIGVKP